MEWNAEHYTKKERKKERTKEERRKVEQSTTIEFQRRNRDWNGEPKLTSDGLQITEVLQNLL